MTDTLILILLLMPALVIAIVFHEVAHGRVALMLGDGTVKANAPPFPVLVSQGGYTNRLLI